ncbi:MAG: GPO family capsid scaffolding protein [Pseudomonadota bacterium]
MPKKISKPFAIATEGQTIDGRNIQRDWLAQMAKHYDPKVYTAVANIEHLLSLAPDGMFSAQGRVLSLGTQEADILGEKRLQLTAVVEVDEAVAAMQASGKKAFSSMEITPNFANKGIVYLTGLAFTDRPASLGTEPMKFSAGKDNVYAFGGDGVEIVFEDVKETTGQSLFAKVMGYLTGKDRKDEDRFADTGKAVEAIAASQRDLLDKFGALADQAKAAQTAADKAAADLAAFQAKLDATDATEPRAPATGGNGKQVTDC